MVLWRRLMAAAVSLSLVLGSPAAAALAAAAAPEPAVAQDPAAPSADSQFCAEQSGADEKLFLECLLSRSSSSLEGFLPSSKMLGRAGQPLKRTLPASLGEFSELDALKYPHLAAVLFDGSKGGGRRDLPFLGVPGRASESSRRSGLREKSTVSVQPAHIPASMPLSSVGASPLTAYAGERYVDETLAYLKKVFEEARDYLCRKWGKHPPPPPPEPPSIGLPPPPPPPPAKKPVRRPARKTPSKPVKPPERTPEKAPAPQPEPPKQPEQVKPEPPKEPAPPAELPKPPLQPAPPPQEPAPAKPPIDVGPSPKFVPGNLNEGVYDVLSWGFWGGDSKGVLDMARKDVNAAAMEFSRSVTPALSSNLRKIFLQLEENTKTGEAAKLRFDFSMPADWYQVGAVTGKFLNAIDGAQKAIEGVLARYSGLFYEAAAVELELALVGTALKAGAVSAPAAQSLQARKTYLDSQKDKLQKLMRTTIGREKDFTAIVAPEDVAYLTLLAKDSGDGFLSDARTKLWLAKRVDEVMGIIEFQVKRKAALEALKMALLAEKDLGDGKKDVIEDFLKLTREGLPVASAIDSATQSADLRQAVLDSQNEFAATAEAGSHLKMAKALRQLSLYDVVPNLRLGFEEGWESGHKSPVGGFGVSVRWAATSAIRLLWSNEDVAQPRLEEEIAKMNVLQASRDKAYNFDRAGAAVARYSDKIAFDGSYPNAEDIALYGRARQVYSYSPEVVVPKEVAALDVSSSSPTVLGTMKDLLTATVENSPLNRMAQLKLEQSEQALKKSEQRVNLEVGFSGGEVVLDSLIPSLIVTLENLGRQKEAAQVKRLGASLRQAKTLFELMYAVLHYANDYLYALEKADAAKEAVAAALASGDRAAVQTAQAAVIDASYRVKQAEAELRRLLGQGVALPSKDVLKEMFSRGSDQLYWGNPLFKHLNMDATLSEAANRVYEDLVETQKALAAVPEVKIYLSSVLAMILSPAMPWMNVLVALDAARTGLPLLSKLFSSLFPGKAEEERQAKLTDFYRQLWANKKSADALSQEYVRQREEIKTMGQGVPEDPKNAEQSHQFNRWRIAALAYDVAPGAEDFLGDRVVEMVEAGRLKEAAELWKFSHAQEKLEPGEKPSKAGELLRGRLNGDEEFKKDLSKQILAAGDWFEAKLLFDPWIENFKLDFGPEAGGKIVAKIVQKGYVAFFESGGKEGEGSVVAQLKEAVAKGDLAAAYELYKKQLAFESHKKAALAKPGVPGAEEAPIGADKLKDTAQQRALTRRVIALVRAGQYQKGQEVLSAAAGMYEAEGLDFDRYYPGLKSWVVGWVARNASPAEAKPFDLNLELPSWLHEGVADLREASYKREPVRRGYRLSPEWDLLNGWSGISTFESSSDREHGISENFSMMRETYDGKQTERQQYSFSGPMGPLGDMRFNAGGSSYLTRENVWNPFSSVSSDGGTDAYYSLGLTQRGLLPGFDLSEKFVHRLYSSGARRDEYGLGTSGLWNGSYNFADVTLFKDTDPDKYDGKTMDHFRSYGRFGYGREEDRFSTAFKWQADDLYGYEENKASGEYNISGRYRPDLIKNHETDLFWSGTTYKNRSYVTSGRYYADTYTKDVSDMVSMDFEGTPKTDGALAYTGLRQMLVEGKYGGLGMGYAVQTETGDKTHEYRSVSYVAPGGHGQIDVISSDDPSVGTALQTQLSAGPGLVRLGVDASSYTAVVGLRDSSGNLGISGILAQSVQDASSKAWGAALSSLDSNYQALWSNHGHDVAVSIHQGDAWLGNGMQFDYRKSSYSEGETYRLKMALSSFTEASDWTNYIPFAPLVKGIAKSVGNMASSKDEKTKEQVSEELKSASSREELAKKAADLLESASRRAGSQESSNRSAALFLGDIISSMSEGYDEFKQQGNTSIPYSWKPDYQVFLASLSDLIPELRSAQENVLYDRSERLEKPRFAWTPKVVDQLDDVLGKYETYRAAYREQIWAIPVSGGIDKRPDHIAVFNKKSQWFVDYITFLKTEFLDMDRIGKMSDEELRNQLAALYRLHEEKPSDGKMVPAKKALEFLGPSEWLPTSTDIPVRVLDNRISRLIAERQKREAIEARIKNLKSRASSSGQQIPEEKKAEPQKKEPVKEAPKGTADQ